MSRKFQKMMTNTSWMHRRQQEHQERDFDDEPLTPKEQEYADMIAGTDPFNVQKHAKKDSKYEKHLRYIINSFENGDTAEEISDTLDCDSSNLRRFLRNRMGQNWYDHNVNCTRRSEIMRDTYRNNILELVTKGYTMRIIAKRLNLTIGKVQSWYYWYLKNPT